CERKPATLRGFTQVGRPAIIVAASRSPRHRSFMRTSGSEATELAGARHRIAASGVVEILQLLSLEVTLDWRGAVGANLLNSKRPCLEHEPVDATKNSAFFV